MHAAFKLHPTKGPFARNRGDDFLIAAHFAVRDAFNFNPPTARSRIALIHAEKIASEQGCFIATSSSADFQNHIGFVVGILRQKQDLQILFHGRNRFPQDLKLSLRHLRHFIAVGQIEDHLLQLNAFRARFF